MPNGSTCTDDYRKLCCGLNVFIREQLNQTVSARDAFMGISGNGRLFRIQPRMCCRYIQMEKMGILGIHCFQYCCAICKSIL